MKKYHFSMILSEFHLFKVLPMYVSLSKYCDDFELFILAMNDSVDKVLNKIGFENITVVKLEELEKSNTNLTIAKSNRTFHEYCWTLKPVFLEYIINKYSDAVYYAHVDADLFFFSNIDSIFNENSNASIFLTDHRNSEEFMHYYELSGQFNTGFVGFRNTDEGKAAIKLWRDRCLKRCTAEYDTINKTFGDQRYVEDWIDIFKDVHVVKSIGANVAFWNVKNYEFSKVDDLIYVNNQPLIFYHFCALVTLGSKEVELCSVYTIKDRELLNLVYEPYIKYLSYGINELKKEFPWFNSGFVDKNNISEFKNYRII